MSAFRELATSVLSATGTMRLARSIFAREGRFVVMFHGIATRRYPDLPRDIQPDLTVDDLRRVLRWIRERFDLLTPAEFFAGEKRGVLLTFDDGLASNFFNALPILREAKAPAIFFVSVQHIVKPTHWLPNGYEEALSYWPAVADVPREIGYEFWDGMTIEQLQACALDPLISIGGHTYSHPRLTTCVLEELVKELTASRRWLQEMTGQPVDLFAYPYGDYNREVAEATRDAGYTAAFVDDTLGIDLPDYEISRVGLYDSDSAYLDVKLSGLYKRPQ